MNISKKDISNIEGVFMVAAVAEHLGKKQAAAAMNTSVDTMNKYISDLENELGVKLLSSNGRGSIMTMNGRLIADKGKKIKSMLHEIYDVKPNNIEVKGEVRVGMSVGARSNLIPRDLGDLFDKYSELSIVFTHTYDVPNLNDMSYDIALIFDEPTGSDLVIIQEQKMECGFFASPRYLSQHGYPIDLEDMLQNYRVLSRTDGNHRIKGWKDSLKKAKDICFQTNTAFDLADAITNGVGIGILPMRYKSDGLVCLDNIKCEADLKIYLVAHKSSKDLPKNRAVIDYYRNLMRHL